MSFHVLLYCYASLCCGSHLQRHNPVQYQFSTWDLFMIVAGSHSMLQQKATVTTFRGEVLRYSHVATTFPIYYCTLKTVAMTCHYNIFLGKTRYHTVQSVLLPGRCSQAGLNHTVAIGRQNKTLTTVKILISMCELTRFK